MESDSENVPKEDCSSTVNLQVDGIKVICSNALELRSGLSSVVLLLFLKTNPALFHT